MPGTAHSTAVPRGEFVAVQFAVVNGMPQGAVPAQSGDDAWHLDWDSDRRNAARDLSSLCAISRVPCPPVLEDLLDIATAVYLADIASPRGTLQEWVRDIQISVPVRDLEFWLNAHGDLTYLLYTLTRDNISIQFHQHEHTEPSLPPPPTPVPDVDCVCLLSGGLDSFAGAAMLLHTGRTPLLLSHQSGNPATEAAQRQVVASLERLAPGQATWVGLRIAPSRATSHTLPFPPPASRENSRRARSILFMAMAATAAHAVGVPEAYMCENGILTAALPLTPARTGSLSTRSTHPVAIKLFADILSAADLACDILNPFTHQTKAEIIRTFLKPLIPPAEIAQTLSCWAAGRHHRQCGGCIPCILRRISLLAAGLADEAYMIDVLATPQEHRGTDAYGNLVDLITQAATLLGRTDLDILLEFPQLLDLEVADVSVQDTLRALKRHAAEVYRILREYFPASAALFPASAALFTDAIH